MKELFKKKLREGQKMTGALNAWIAPNGDFFQLAFAEHNDFANAWLEDKFGGGDSFAAMTKIDHELNRNKLSYAYELLVSYGWIRLMCWMPDKKKGILHSKSGSDRGLTEQQKNIIEEWELWNKDFTLEWIS